MLNNSKVVSVQFRSVAQSCPTFCDPMDCRMPGLLVNRQLPEFVQIHVHWLSRWCHQPSHPLLSPSPPTFNLPQHQGLFKWVSSLHQVAKVLSFSLNISPSNEHPGLISFRMDWLDLLAVQGTLKSVLQHHSSKASILHCSALWPNSHIHKWLLDKPKLWLYRPLSVMSCLCFLICCHSFSFKKHASFNFMAAVTICNDFGAQENKVWTLNSFINSFIYHSSWLFFIFFFSSWLLIMSLQYHFHKIDF